MAAALTISGPGFNPFSRVWAAYERSLRRRPVLTQAASSALLWGLGDAMAQRIETRGRGGIDSRRVALTAAFGGAVIGPAGHGWYLMLERLVLKLGLACSMKSMLLKVAVDNLVYSPAYVFAFFAFGCMAIDGLSPAQFTAKMREEFVPTMLAEALVWPPYMCAVFSRVPVQHQLLAVNVATLFDVCFLSWMRTKDDAGEPEGLAQTQQQKQEQQKGELRAVSELQQPSQARGSSGGAASEAATGKASVRLEESSERGRDAAQQKQQQRRTEEFEDVVRSRDAAVAALLPWWDGSSGENLNPGRMTLMAASATCSTAGGGGWFRGMLPAAAAEAAPPAARC